MMRSNDKGTRISKRTSRYEIGINGSQENNGRIAYEQIRCQKFCISHGALRDETGTKLYIFKITLYHLLTPSFHFGFNPCPLSLLLLLNSHQLGLGAPPKSDTMS